MSDRPQFFWITGGLMIVFAVIWLKGCGYGTLSHSGYQHAQALYAICNRQDETALNKFSQRVAEMQNDNSLQDEEANWLNSIIEQARSGEWQAAQLETRELMESQLDE